MNQRDVQHLLDEVEQLRAEVEQLRAEVETRQQVEEALRQATLKLEGIFEAFPDLLFILAADGTILEYHAGKGFKFQVLPSDFMGRPMQEVLPPDVGRQFAEGLDQVNNSGEMVRLEFHLIVQGQEHHREARLLVMPDEQILLAVREITDRKQAEAELRQVNEEMESLFRTLPDLKFRLDATGIILDYRAGQVIDLYLPPEGFMGQRMQDVLPPSVGHLFNRAIDRVLGGEAQVFIEYTLPMQGGIQYFEARLLPLAKREVLVIVRDSSERRRREILQEGLRNVREQVLRMRDAEDIEGVLQAIRQGLVALGIPFHGCSINIVDDAGPSPKVAFYNMTETESWITTETEAGPEVLVQMWRRGQVEYRPDLEAEDKYGERADVLAEEVGQARSVIDIPFSHGTLSFSSSAPNAFSAQDITLMEGMTDMLSEGFQRIEDLQKLAAEHEQLVVTLRSIGDGVITTDREGRVVLINQVAEELTGWIQEEAAGQPLRQVFDIINEQTRQPCPSPVDQVLARGRIIGLANHTALIARDGSERSIADSGAPIRQGDGNIIGVVLVFRDVSTQRRLEAELQRTQKLESIGLLAGGIAHDFNNLLAGIIGNLSVAKLDVDPSSELFEIFSDVERSAFRSRELTQQLLTFAKGGAPVKETASLKEVVRESADFVLRGSAVQCLYELAEDLWPASVDRGQISQVLQNLVINAVQAMPTGGTVRIGAVNRRVRPSELPLPEGDYVEVMVRDEGGGIPPEHLQRIFDPYFTTKQQGSGLGLATSYSIIANHDGHISVSSNIGQGTTFYVFLPAVPEESVAPPRGEAQITLGSGRVLLMDDEEIVRQLAIRMLERLGYKVEAVEDGTKVLALYEERRAEGLPFDAVVMDLTVPGGMGGKETIKQLLALDPQARAIVSSGYSDDPIMANCAAYGFRGVIAKPYDVQAMSQILYQVVSGG